MEWKSKGAMGSWARDGEYLAAVGAWSRVVDGVFQAAGFSLMPSMKTTPFTTLDNSGEPLNDRHPFDALSILRVGHIARGVSDRRAQDRGCHPARFACGLGDSPDQEGPVAVGGSQLGSVRQPGPAPHTGTCFCRCKAERGKPDAICQQRRRCRVPRGRISDAGYPPGRSER
jgi:hypothetical protein